MDSEMREGGEQTCTHESGCDTCETPTERPRQEGKEEISLAFLLALMPLVVLTFFGQVGLI